MAGLILFRRQLVFNAFALRDGAPGVLQPVFAAGMSAVNASLSSAIDWPGTRVHSEASFLQPVGSGARMSAVPHDGAVRLDALPRESTRADKVQLTRFCGVALVGRFLFWSATASGPLSGSAGRGLVRLDQSLCDERPRLRPSLPFSFLAAGPMLWE